MKFISETFPDFLARHSLVPEWTEGTDPFALMAKSENLTREEVCAGYSAESGFPIIPVSLISSEESFRKDPLLPIVYSSPGDGGSVTALSALPLKITRGELDEIAASIEANSLHIGILSYDDYLALVRVFNPQPYPFDSEKAANAWELFVNGGVLPQNTLLMPLSDRKKALSAAPLPADLHLRYIRDCILLQYPVLSSASPYWDNAACGMLSMESVQGYGVCPLSFFGGNLLLACSGRIDRMTLGTIRAKLPDAVKAQFVLIPPAELESLAAQYGVALASREFTKSKEGSVSEVSVENVHEINPESVRRGVRDNLDAGNFSDALLLRGFNDGASDIHMSMAHRTLRIRLRINGILRDIQEEPISFELSQAVISRIKILAGIDVQYKELPQDGQFKFRVGDKLCEVRVNSSETVDGSHMVMRLQLPNESLSKLEQLGIDAYELGVIRQSVNADNGMIIICGPTGSGKSTTLYAVLESINRKKYKVVTGEQPVERRICDVEQTHIKKGGKYTFFEFVAAAMRQDPDYILIGETRDSETAREIIRASITGHVVMTTLHTNTAAMAPSRLIDLSGEPYLIADALTALCSQRLLPRLCPYCKEPVNIPDSEKLARMGIREEWLGGAARIFKPKGCSYCHGTGSAGRLCIMEAFLINSEMRELISRKAGSRELAYAQRRAGSMGLYEKAVRRMADGEVALEEVLPLRICEI